MEQLPCWAMPPSPDSSAGSGSEASRGAGFPMATVEARLRPRLVRPIKLGTA